MGVSLAPGTVRAVLLDRLTRSLGTHPDTATQRDGYDALKAINNGKDELPKIANKLRALADLLQPIQTEVPTSDDEATP